MAQRSAKWRRERGSIDELPSAAVRVRVYAGVDPLTHRRHYLLELAPTRAEAELVRTGPYLDRLPLGDRCADVVGVLDAGRYARNETLREGSVALPTVRSVSN